MPKNNWPVTWSKRSERDLLDIWNYYAENGGLQTADKIVNELIASTKPLGDFPRIGRQRDEVSFGLRSVVCVPFVLFYKISNDELRIVRVIDGRRDIEEVDAEDDNVAD